MNFNSFLSLFALVLYKFFFFFLFLTDPGARYEQYLIWLKTIEFQPIQERTYSDHLALGVILNMQAVYDCKRESSEEDKARTEAFKARVDGNVDDVSFNSRLDNHPNDENIDDDTEHSTHTVPINIPDDDLMFAFDTFSGATDFVDSDFLQEEIPSATELQHHLPIMFSAPRGLLFYFRFFFFL